MRRAFVTLLFAMSSGLYAESLPDWFVPLREAVYEQRLSADEIQAVYQDVKGKAEKNLSGPALDLILSRCEYMMGRAYQYEERKDEAALHYAEGILKAEQALAGRQSDEGWQMLGENISQSCAVRPVSFAMANGLKVEQYAKKSLALNSRNAAAQYLIAARWVYAPSPFNNYRKGIEMMSDILSGGDVQKDDLFNVYSAIGYAYVQQKKYAEAGPWLEKSLEVYPTNKYARSLLQKK